jgi:hypothetical protein
VAGATITVVALLARLESKIVGSVAQSGTSAGALSVARRTQGSPTVQSNVGGTRIQVVRRLSCAVGGISAISPDIAWRIRHALVSNLTALSMSAEANQTIHFRMSGAVQAMTLTSGEVEMIIINAILTIMDINFRTLQPFIQFREG